MSSLDSSALISAAKWSETSHQLKEFSAKYDFPQIGKISRGQYLNIGVPSLSSPSLSQIVLWGSGGKRVNVIAQSVRFKEGSKTSAGSTGRSVPTGPKLVIPDNYDGWWEILSEEGKSVRCIESVADLSKRCGDQCLVRDNIKAYMGKTDDPNVISDKQKTIQTGELLTLVGTDVVTPPSVKSNGGYHHRYLRCRTTKGGDTVYLSLDQKGKFSPVAREGISGVHTISNLLSKRLPLMVRLVYGKPPQGYKQFHSDIRLFSTYEDECFVALPLTKDINKDTNNCLTQVPIGSSLKVLGPKNGQQLCEMPEFGALKELSAKLSQQGLTGRIHLLDTQTLSKEVKALLKEDNSGNRGKFAFKFQGGGGGGGGSGGHQYDHKRRLQSNSLVKRSLSDPQQINGSGGGGNDMTAAVNEPLKRGTSLDDSHKEANASQPSLSCGGGGGGADTDNEFYDEIDQIYDYVRGFAPLPDRIRNELKSSKVGVKATQSDPAIVDILNKENRPEPPPIITIPSIQKQHQQHHHHQQHHRFSYPMTTPQKVTVNVKKVKKYFPTKDYNIFNKNNNKNNNNKSKEEKIVYFPNVRIHYNNCLNAGNGVYLPTQSPVCTTPIPQTPSQQQQQLLLLQQQQQYPINGQKLFVKSSSGQRNTWKANRFLKYAKHVSAPFRSDAAINEIDSCRSSRSLTTSPIFNIRYKSMNNLHYIKSPAMDYNNTLDSSHSGQTTSSGSGSRDLFRDPKPKFPKLSRSLNNVFWDIGSAAAAAAAATAGNYVTTDTIDKLNNELNDRKNKNCIQLLPVHIDFLNALDRLQQQQNQQQQQQLQQQLKEHTIKNRHLATLYL
ncbi:uncharacterized protein LOC128952795 [Oppia nitens]|uniref:uncharacterized protein LOC128952795 n=1 Tax=Oppia nitens TaxID=1686743 RepID=UPI0023DA019C|nr:uncharacterized protein LOC128952795 [Oppia nitens]